MIIQFGVNDMHTQVDRLVIDGFDDGSAIISVINPNHRQSHGFNDDNKNGVIW